MWQPGPTASIRSSACPPSITRLPPRTSRHQAYYAFSTLTCTAVSRSQEVGLALGAQAGPARLIGVLEEAGFRDIRLAAEGQTNIVLEAVAG